MLNEKTRLYLEQILDAINKIEISTVGLSVEAYEDHEVKWLVERRLLIVGEALNRIRVSEPNLVIENSQKILATRNKIAHEYDVVDHDILHSIVTLHLPALKKEIALLIGKN